MNNLEKGFSLVEAILATALFAIGVTGFIGAFIVGSDSQLDAHRRTAAYMYATEGMEVVRELSEAGFSGLFAGSYGIATSSNLWILTGSSDIRDIYTRVVEISDIDANRKDVTITVSWIERLMPQSLVIEGRITNWRESVGGFGNWASPRESGTYDVSGNQDGYRIDATDTYAFLARQGGSPEFVVLDISNTTTPSISDSIAVVGTLSDMAVSGNYAAFSSNQNNAEFELIDISNPLSISSVSTLNLTGNTDASSIALSGTTAYVGRNLNSGDELYVVSILVPGVPAVLGSLELGATPRDMVLIGNYLFIASENNSQEIQVVNVLVPATPVLVETVDLTGNTDATALDGFGSTLVVGRSDGDVVTLDISDPLNISVEGTVSTGGSIHGISFDSGQGYVFIGTGDVVAEFKVIDVSTLTSPTLVGTLDLSSSNLFDVFYLPNRDIAVTANSDNTAELLIIESQ